MDKAGFLQDYNGGKRLRIVKEGYDADDPLTPFDAVLFDSESDGMGSVLETGQAVIPATGTFTAGTTGMWLRTWSYGFTPLCIFSFKEVSGVSSTRMWDHSQWARISASSGTITQPRITVSNGGIWLRGGFGKVAGADFTVAWTAFRVNAA